MHHDGIRDTVRRHSIRDRGNVPWDPSEWHPFNYSGHHDTVDLFHPRQVVSLPVIQCKLRQGRPVDGPGFHLPRPALFLTYALRSNIYADANTSTDCSIVYEFCSSCILNRQSVRLEQGYLRIIAASRFFSGNDIAQFGLHV